MTKVSQKVWAVILAAVLMLSVVGAASVAFTSNRASAATSSTAATTKGVKNLTVKKLSSGKWATVNKKTGKFVKYTGIAENSYGWWRIENGYVNFKANGVYSNEYGQWYVVNGKVDFNKYGLVKSGNNYYSVRAGKATLNKNPKQYDANQLVVRRDANGVWSAFDGDEIAYDYTGIAPNIYGWWRIVDGRVDFNATGIYSNNNGNYFVKDGHVDFAFSGLVTFEGKTYTVVLGEAKIETEIKTDFPQYSSKYDTKSLTVKKNAADGQWYAYTNKGKIAYDYTGVARNEYGWWAIENGKVDFTACGLYANEYGVWYVVDGKVDFGYNGSVSYDGKMLKVVAGLVDVR